MMGWFTLQTNVFQLCFSAKRSRHLEYLFDKIVASGLFVFRNLLSASLWLSKAASIFDNHHQNTARLLLGDVLRIARSAECTMNFVNAMSRSMSSVQGGGSAKFSMGSKIRTISFVRVSYLRRREIGEIGTDLTHQD